MHASTLLASLRPSRDEAGTGAPDLAQALCAEAPRLRRLVHRLLGWRAAADELDDVVQEVLLKAWQHHRSFRGDAALTTWLSRITIHATHDHVRTTSRRRRLFGWLRPDAPEPTCPSPADDEPLDRTRLAMQQLAHQDREVLVLRYLEQREIPDIADLLGLRRGAVDARLTRARDRLRAMLAHEERS